MHAIYAAEHGAKSVLGIDISQKMLEVARKNTPFPQVTYQQMAMENMDFPKDSFDLVLSSLVFHYTKAYELIIQKIYNALETGGLLVFSVEHPIFTAQGPQDWFYDDYGNAIHWPLDHYFSTGEREATFLATTVQKYHRTLTDYIAPLLQANFSIDALIEPMPSPTLLKAFPEMAEELRRPMMLIIAAQKK